MSIAAKQGCTFCSKRCGLALQTKAIVRKAKHLLTLSSSARS